MTTPHIDIDECVQRYIAAFDEIAYIAEQLANHMGIATHYEISKDYLNAMIEKAEDLELDALQNAPYRCKKTQDLFAPRVPVTPGLDEAIAVFEKGVPDLSDYEIVGVYLADCERYEDRCHMVADAARAYAELQKGV